MLFSSNKLLGSLQMYSWETCHACSSSPMGSLELLLGRCPVMALDVICSYLDYKDFLNLSGTCKGIRCSMISQAHLWRRFYDQRESVKALKPILCPIPEEGRNYRLNSDHKVNGALESLVNLAQHTGVLPIDGSHGPSVYLALAILSAACSRRIRINQDVLKEVPQASCPIIASENGDISKPFTVVNKTNLFGSSSSGKLFRTKLVTPVTDETRINVISARWVRKQRCPFCASKPGESDPTTSDNGSYLSLLYSHASRDVALSTYRYDSKGFSHRPHYTWKISVPPADIQCFDAFADYRCGHFSLFLGTSSGSLYMRSHDREERFEVSDVSILHLDAVSIEGKWLLCLSLGNDRALFMSISKEATVVKSLSDVSSFAFDIKHGIIGYCTSKRCTVSFSRFTGLEAKVGVPKPPTAILFLHRRSLWLLVIRNYLKLVELDESSGTLIVKNVRVLNGHVSPISECHSDGWHRLVSIDTNGNVIIWDFIKGVKIMGFPLCSGKPPSGGPGRRPRDRSPARRNKTSVNQQITYASIHDAKKNFNMAPAKSATYDSEDELSDFKQLKLCCNNGNEKIVAGKHRVHFSTSGLHIYYHKLCCIRIVSFK